MEPRLNIKWRAVPMIHVIWH